MPGPVTDASDDGWFVWEPFWQRGADSIAATNPQYMFDSKAMRTVQEGFQIAVIVENASAAHVCEFGMGMSLLSSRT